MPVSTDWSIESSCEERMRMSAGMMPPVSTKTMSPGTRSRASTGCLTPSRRTFALNSTNFASFSSACSLLYSCTKPRSAFTTTIPIITSVSVISPSTPETIEARTRMRTSGLVNWLSIIPSAFLRFRNSSSFLPSFASLACASWLVSPFSSELPSPETAFAAAIAS